eukprot:5646083-Amphidinium_carterae.1
MSLLRIVHRAKQWITKQPWSSGQALLDANTTTSRVPFRGRARDQNLIRVVCKNTLDLLAL